MNGLSTIIAGRVESLLPRTSAAAACVPNSFWSSTRSLTLIGDGIVCGSGRECHLSCHGKAICGAWGFFCSS